MSMITFDSLVDCFWQGKKHEKEIRSCRGGAKVTSDGLRVKIFGFDWLPILLLKATVFEVIHFPTDGIVVLESNLAVAITHRSFIYS